MAPTHLLMRAGTRPSMAGDEAMPALVRRSAPSSPKSTSSVGGAAARAVTRLATRDRSVRPVASQVPGFAPPHLAPPHGPPHRHATSSSAPAPRAPRPATSMPPAETGIWSTTVCSQLAGFKHRRHPFRRACGSQVVQAPQARRGPSSASGWRHPAAPSAATAPRQTKIDHAPAAAHHDPRQDQHHPLLGRAPTR